TRRVGGAGIGDSTFSSAASLATSGLTLQPTPGKFTVNGVSIDASAAASIDDFVAAINAKTNDPLTPTNVRADLVDSAGNPSATPTKIKLSNADGSFTAISLGSAGDTSNFLTATKLATAVQGAGTD